MLIIEDGTNVVGAEAWADAASFTAWVTNYYGAAPTQTEAEQEAAIRRSVAYLNTLRWHGGKTYGRTQSLSWPRIGVSDCEGFSIEPSEIPGELIQAQHALAYAEIATPGILAPSGTNIAVRRERVDVIEVEYDTSRADGTADDLRTTVTGAIDVLKCFLAVVPGGRGYYPAAMVV